MLAHLSLEFIMFMWFLNVRCSSIINQRYLISVLGLSLDPFNFNLRSVLDEFSEILLDVNQLFNAFKSMLSLLTRFLFLILLGVYKED